MKKERGEVRKISDLFNVYRNRLIAPERSVITAFVEVVEDVCSLEIDATHITYNPNTKTLSLKTQDVIKTEVLLYKTEIINHLKGRLGIQNAPNNIL